MFANGKTSFDQGYDVGPNGTVELPSTLGVVSGESASTVVRITVRGYETPCAASNDCNDGTDEPVGSSGSRILRRSVQTFVDQRTLFVPMPLSLLVLEHRLRHRFEHDVQGQHLRRRDDDRERARRLRSVARRRDRRVLRARSICFDDKPEGGTSLSVAPVLVDAGTCTYEYPGPAPVGLNVRAYYQNFAWNMDSTGQFQPVLHTGGEQEILNEDPVEGFTLVATPDAGPGAGVKGSLFRLAPGLCKLATAASDPPPTPATGGAATYITISNLRVSPVCPPKSPLLPICKGEQTNGPALPTGEVTTDVTCNVGVPLAPTQSALYLVMDQSQVMHGAFGPMGSATALSLSLSDPVFKRTFAAFTFLPGLAADCTSAMTSFTMPEIDFGLASTVQAQIAAKLKGWTAPDTAANPNPLELQAAMRFDAGAYKHLTDFLVSKDLPNIAATMFFVNRAPTTVNDCDPPLGATVQGALESEILQAYSATPSLQTYFVVLDDDAHDSSTPNGALTFFKKVQADLPQAVQLLDATQTNSMQAAQTAAANFSKLVTQLGTCVYDYGLPANTDVTKLEVAFTVPGKPQTVVPSSSACTAATQGLVNGWNLDNGRLRICGSSCDDLRQGILAAAGAALMSGQPTPDIPVTATILCDGRGPVNDAGPSGTGDDAEVTADSSTSADAAPVVLRDATTGGPVADGGIAIDAQAVAPDM